MPNRPTLVRAHVPFQTALLAFGWREEVEEVAEPGFVVLCEPMIAASVTELPLPDRPSDCNTEHDDHANGDRDECDVVVAHG
jgi:hypothetical protein